MTSRRPMTRIVRSYVAARRRVRRVTDYVVSRLGMMARGEFHWPSLWHRWRAGIFSGAAVGAAVAAIAVIGWTVVFAFAAGVCACASGIVIVGSWVQGAD